MLQPGSTPEDVERGDRIRGTLPPTVFWVACKATLFPKAAATCKIRTHVRRPERDLKSINYTQPARHFATSSHPRTNTGSLYDPLPRPPKNIYYQQIHQPPPNKPKKKKNIYIYTYRDIYIHIYIEMSDTPNAT